MQKASMLRVVSLLVLVVLVVIVVVVVGLTIEAIHTDETTQAIGSASVPSVADWYNVKFLLVQTIGTAIAVILAWVAYSQTRSIEQAQQKQTKKLSQNQSFVALFEYLRDIHEIPDEI